MTTGRRGAARTVAVRMMCGHTMPLTAADATGAGVDLSEVPPVCAVHVCDECVARRVRVVQQLQADVVAAGWRGLRGTRQQVERATPVRERIERWAGRVADTLDRRIQHAAARPPSQSRQRRLERSQEVRAVLVETLARLSDAAVYVQWRRVLNNDPRTGLMHLLPRQQQALISGGVPALVGGEWRIDNQAALDGLRSRHPRPPRRADADSYVDLAAEDAAEDDLRFNRRYAQDDRPRFTAEEWFDHGNDLPDALGPDTSDTEIIEMAEQHSRAAASLVPHRHAVLIAPEQYLRRQRDKLRADIEAAREETPAERER